MKTCPLCDQGWSDDHRFCPTDGTALFLAEGTVLGGRYRIERVLGKGGMGVVYLAQQLPPLARPCAVKVLHVEAGSQPDAVAEAVERMCQEAGVLAELGPHPNLVAVYDAARDQDGLTYVAMEYVDGEALKEKLSGGVIYSEEHAARIVQLAADGIEYVHRRGIVHRDLKPGNLMLTRNPDRPDWVKVVDFGIAKPLAPEESGILTQTDARLGTDAYMSPEQRDRKPLDHRSDIYSLGLIAVELLADGRPMPNLTGDGRAVFEGMDRSSTWSEETKQVLARALAHHPSDRFDSATEFAGALVSSLGSRRASVFPDDAVPPRGPPFARRSTVMVAGTVAIAAAALWFVSSLDRGGLTTPGDPAPDTLQRPTQGSVAAPPPSPADRRPDGVAGPAPSTVADVPQETTSPEGVGSLPPDDDTVRAQAEDEGRSDAAPDYGAHLAALRELVNLDQRDSLALIRAVDAAALLLADERLPDTTRVEVSYVTAEARMMLGRQEAGCTDLRQIEALAVTDEWVARRYGRAVETLLDLHCSVPL